MNFEFSMGGKWLELLRQIAPNVSQAAILRDTAEGSGTSQFAAIQAVAPSLRVDVKPFNMRDAGEIGRDLEAFAHSPNGGLIVTASAAAALHRDLIVKLAAQHRLPTVYFDRSFVASGGLISHGVDYIDQYQKAAGYVDRILKGEKPADLPVQSPTKYVTVLNLKTAKALGLDCAACAARPRRRGDRIAELSAATHMAAIGRLCCKSRKLQSCDFFAKTQNGTQSTIRIISIALPKSPVSFARGDEVPHIFTRNARLQPAEFLITSAKRLLQHNRTIADMRMPFHGTKPDVLARLGRANRRKFSFRHGCQERAFGWCRPVSR